MGAFSLGYGHVPLFGPEHLHEPLQEYGPWLKAQGEVHTPARSAFLGSKRYKSDDARAERPCLAARPAPGRPPKGAAPPT